MTRAAVRDNNPTRPGDIESLPRYLTVEIAAVRLSTTPSALRARCRRHARREGREVIARLGGGIVAIKFGVSWRVQFPD